MMFDRQASPDYETEAVQKSLSIRLLVLLVLLAVFAAFPVQARCDRDDFVLAIDVGHSSRKPGAISAHGVPEYLFNKRLANRLLDRAHADGFKKAFIINNDDKQSPTL